MPHAKAESSTSAKQGEADRGALSGSSGLVAPLKREKNPPAYGAQHRQDALWEGGNEALPPSWCEESEDSEDIDEPPFYQDLLLGLGSSHRPLPGVRLDCFELLITGWEWHISPLGRSYFVNHNTRSTSWKKPTPERPAGCLMPLCTIKGSGWWKTESLACLGTNGDIMIMLDDGLIRQWTKAGQPIGQPLNSHAGDAITMAVSPDQSMVVGTCKDGKVRLWNMKDGSLVGHPWEGNDDEVMCLDWSPNGAEVAGGLRDGTIRRWNPATGRQIAPLIKSSDLWVNTIKYSPQGDKFASGSEDDIICVWSKDGELLIEITGDNLVTSLCWSKDGAYIFSALWDHTIRKLQSINGEELFVFRGHTRSVESLCLSPDGCHLVSASNDYSIRIWDLESNQQVGDPLWHDGGVSVVAMSSDGQYFTSAIFGQDAKIYVWSLSEALQRARVVGPEGDAESNAKLKGRAAPFRDISFVPRRQSNKSNRGLARYGNDFWGDDTNRTPLRSSSLPGLCNLFDFLRSSTRPTNTVQPRRLNFSLFPVKLTRRPVDVAHCQLEDRYGIVPETDAEAEAAMQRTNSNNVDGSTQQGQAVAKVQEFQGQGVQGQSSTEETLIGCCGFYLVRRRPASN